MSRPEVLIVGAGVIGCAIARALATRGVDTLLLDRDEPGTHASWAAAGMLAPNVEADEPDAFLTLLQDSARLFPALVEALREETGIDVAHSAAGTLLLALTVDDERALETRFRWQSAAGLAVERLSPTAARALEPAISPDLRLALRFGEDHQVDNRLLARALASAATQAGARFRQAEVAGLRREGERIVGVELRDGERVEAERVVIAAGCWSGRLAGLPRELPVRPVHGQLLALGAPVDLLTHVVDTPRVYLVPRRDGRVIVGTTTEETGFRKEVTAAAIARLRAAAAEAVPALRGAEVLESWSGLRPGTPDGRPILGAEPRVRNLFYATGHYRNGILLTPITAALLSDLLLDRSVDRDLTPFAVDRFG